MVEPAENLSIEFVRVAARETGLLRQFTEAPHSKCTWALG